MNYKRNVYTLKNPPKNPYIATEGLKVWREMQEQAQRNGLSEMTLEEINAEIYAARREREAREAQTRKENESC